MMTELHAFDAVQDDIMVFVQITDLHSWILLFAAFVLHIDIFLGGSSTARSKPKSNQNFHDKLQNIMPKRHIFKIVVEFLKIVINLDSVSFLVFGGWPKAGGTGATPGGAAKDQPVLHGIKHNNCFFLD